MFHLPRSPHIVFAGGGTAGHVFPALAVAEALRARDPQVRLTFVGGGGRLERRLAEQAGCRYLAISAEPTPRSAWKAWRFVREQMAGYKQARLLMQADRPDVAIGLGGYVSVPTARAALAADVPLVLIEANAVAGRAVRWLAPSATLTCLALDSARDTLRTKGAIRVTGLPVRDGFFAERFAMRAVPPGVAEAFGLAAQPARRKRLVILGGSQGSHSLNEQVPRALYRVRDALSRWTIVHQTGRADREATIELYRKLGLKAIVVAFLDPLPRALRRAELAICRSGGSTLAELAAAGLPAVLVPYPHSRDDHQLLNAQQYTDAGACHLCDQRESDGRLDLRLAGMLSSLLVDRFQRDRMARAMRGMSRPTAARQVAWLVDALARDGQLPSQAPLSAITAA
jgi:UDP-N-acetylglucosamine--N-acetylmuramyl-(pentapeptide) pyrophosphoryl-undecaprenol N-acetylglucosamine transferase